MSSLCASIFCNYDELRENFANTDCPAEELGIGCPNLTCRSSEPDIEIFKLELCEVIDCQTLSCDNFSVDNGASDQSGFMTDITVDEETGLPIGFFDLDTIRGEFTCVLIQP